MAYFLRTAPAQKVYVLCPCPSVCLSVYLTHRTHHTSFEYAFMEMLTCVTHVSAQHHPSTRWEHTGYCLSPPPARSYVTSSISQFPILKAAYTVRHR